MKANSVRCSRATVPVTWARKLPSTVVAVFFGIGLCARIEAASVSLAWNPNPEPDVIGYRIYYGPAGETPTTSQDAGTATTATVSNLQEGASYDFYATAYNSAGLESELSSPVSYTVPSTANNLLVSWEQSFSVSANTYSIFYGPPGETPAMLPAGTNLSTTISNVIRGEAYEISAQAYDSAGTAVTQYNPTNYTIPHTGSIGSVHLLPIDQPPTISLTSPETGSRFYDPATIQISVYAHDDDAVKFVDLFAGSALLTRVTAAPYYFSWPNAPVGQHEIYAIAVDTLDQFTRSSSAIVTVESTAPTVAPPTAPADLEANVHWKNGRVRLTWIDTAVNEHSYLVERSANGTNFYSVATLSADATRFTDSDVPRGILLYYRVRAVNDGGSNSSNIVPVQT